jgi:DNA-directed RNA polymerase-3 subunit RPC5
MALARMNESGTRLDVVPLRRHVLQMRPTFDHLHDNDDDGGGGDDNDDFNNNNAGINDDTAASSTTTKAKPIMYARKETERSAVARRSTYAHKKASEASEEWITLDVHGSEGQWSAVRKETLARVKCGEKEKTLRLATIGHENDEDGRGAGYVKSLNYLDSSGGGSGGAGANFVENLSTTDYNDNVEMTENDDGEVVSVSASERATAELAAKLAVLMQNGSGTMIPYCVIRSLFHASKVSDDMLTVALSSCAVLVRGNFALKSILAKFLTSASTTGAGGGGGVTKLKLLRQLRDLILLLLNMHGMVGRQRLIKAFSEYDSIIDPDTITFVLKTVARQSHNMSRNCWVAKVDDDENFALDFPGVAACHAMYWTKKEEMLADLINLYEDAD